MREARCGSVTTTRAARRGCVGRSSASHCRRELVHDGEAQAGADGTAGRGTNRIEPGEHVGQIVRRNARAVVGDDDGQLGAAQIGRDLDDRCGVLQRVLDQVGDDLTQTVGIDVGRNGGARQYAQLQRQLAGLRRERRRGVAYDLGRVTRTRAE